MNACSHDRERLYGQPVGPVTNTGFGSNFEDPMTKSCVRLRAMASRRAPHLGDGFAHALLDGGLHVTLLFGRPTEAVARELTAILDAEPFDVPRLSLFDAHAIESIEPDAFSTFADHQNRRRSDLARVVTKQAIVTPRGMPGAIVTGFRAVFDFSYPVAYFTERAPALAFLGCSSALAAIDDLAASATRPLLVRLRTALLASPALVLADAARQLGVSERSLQRHLHGEGTSFLDEVQAARIACARHLLAETDRKLTVIATEVGCGSLQSFSTMFRRITGETPSEFRARSRTR
jgi:AraC-like DNA-binding protein